MLHVDVKKSRGDFTLNASFELRKPVRVMGIVGPSGSGKSTLLDCIAGVETPDAGRIEFDGAPWYAGHRKTAIPIGERRVGYVFQDGLLFDHLTVDANLRYGQSRARGGPTVDDVARVLGIHHLLNRRATDASGGERRRIALGRAILSGPQLLLLDEPLTGLDAQAAGRVLVYLRRIIDQYQLPTLYVSHSLSDVLYLCDRIIALDAGRVVHSGEAASILSVTGCTGAHALASLRNIIEARGVSSDASSQSVTYETASGVTIRALGTATSGDAAALAVHARDIVIATGRPQGISARNVYQGRIARLVHTESMVVVEIDIGERLWTEVGFETVAELGLAEGRDVWAFFKASAVQRLL
jgi:molybdate transport system ATP-binding protein